MKTDPIPPPDVVSVAEFARAIGKSERFVRSLCEDGTIACATRIGVLGSDGRGRRSQWVIAAECLRAALPHEEVTPSPPDLAPRIVTG